MKRIGFRKAFSGLRGWTRSFLGFMKEEKSNDIEGGRGKISVGGSEGYVDEQGWEFVSSLSLSFCSLVLPFVRFHSRDPAGFVR